MKNYSQDIKKIVKQAIDFHCHFGPEIIPRKFVEINDLITSEKGKIKGIVLKNHFYPTTYFITQKTYGLNLYGGVVLNNSIGGINPEAVYTAGLLTDKPLIVWFPTIDAINFLNQMKYQIPYEWVKKKNFTSRKSNSIIGININKLKRKVVEILKIIRDKNYILATGHINSKEVSLLIDNALKIGNKKIIITHPIYQKIDMAIEQQIALSKKGCFIESCYSMYSIDKIPISKIAYQIKKIGPKQIILSSDVGQTFSPTPSKALFLFGQLLLKEGITSEMLYQMMVSNPNSLLSI